MKWNDLGSRPQRRALGLMLALAGVSAFTGAAHASDDENILVVPLGGTQAEPLADGAATYRVRPGDIKLEIEVEDLRSTTSATFSLDGQVLGTRPVSLGEANIELESERGAVPVLTADSVVTVTNAATGDLIATSEADAVEGDDEGFDDNGGEGHHEGDDEGFDDNGGEGEDEGDDEGFDDNGGEGEDEGDDEGFDDNGGDEGEDEGDDNGGDEGEDEGDDNGGESGELELEFVLSGTPNDPLARGVAELRNEDDRRRIEVEAWSITAASRVSVLVDGVNVGTGRVYGGQVEVKRDERDNYTIPVVTAASRVDVINSETGAIILSNKEVVLPGEGEGEGSGSEGEGEGTVSEGEGEGSTEGETPASDVLRLEQKLGPNGFYVPGEVTTIQAIMTYTGTTPVFALSIEQTLPAGWTFVRTVDTLGAFIQPGTGDTGTLTWAWIGVPRMPATLKYEVMVPADAAGVHTVEGSVLYRRMGGPEYAVASIDAPAGEGFTKEFCHSIDSNQDWNVELGEVLRGIQMYNIGEIHCEDGTEDGYAPGPGDQGCQHHDSDQLNPDWRIELSELLRNIQFYNAEDGAYKVEFETEDGYAPGYFELTN